MWHYILRRLLLIVPTLFGIMLVNFLVIQAAPGGPVEKMVAELRGHGAQATARFGASLSDAGGAGMSTGGMTAGGAALPSDYQAAQGLPPELIEDIKKLYGFDKPPAQRFWHMLGQYLRFDFGESFFRNTSVLDLILEKLPVSISLGLWTTLLIYLISIPLGITKAVRDGSSFDLWTSAAIIIGYAIPSFLFAVLLIVLFAGGSYLDWFPLRGLISDEWQDMSWPARIADYFWHLTLPLTAMVISGFAGLTILTKHSFLDEIAKQYVVTARAKGLSERRVLFGHVFRNAMLIVIAGLPAAVIGILFTSNFLIEYIFSLDGLGLLGFESVINRDYPVVFGTLYLFTLLGLLLNILGDLTYVLVDPRIDFSRRGA